MTAVGHLSPSEDRHRHPKSPHLRVEPTKSGRKRISASECLLGVNRTYLGRLELRLLAMSRNMTFNAENLLS